MSCAHLWLVINTHLFLSITWQMMSGARRNRLLLATALSVCTSICWMGMTSPSGVVVFLTTCKHQREQQSADHLSFEPAPHPNTHDLFMTLNLFTVPYCSFHNLKLCFCNLKIIKDINFDFVYN